MRDFESNFFSEGGTSLSALRFVQLMKKSFSKLRFEVSDLVTQHLEIKLNFARMFIVRKMN